MYPPASAMSSMSNKHRLPALQAPVRSRRRSSAVYLLSFLAGFYCCWLLSSYTSKAIVFNADSISDKQLVSRQPQASVKHPVSSTPEAQNRTKRHSGHATGSPGSGQVHASFTRTPQVTPTPSGRRAIYQKRLQAWRQRLSDKGTPWNKWAPLILDKCEPGMPKHWAPCLKVPRAEVLAAYEVLYPGGRT